MNTNYAQITKPTRYTGHELNSVVKDEKSVSTRVALVFPDVYEIGMSNLGLQILYHILNQQPKIWAERAYAPWPDMEAELRRRGQTLTSLESGKPLAEFDILGITLPYEMCYTNILNILDLAGIPLYAAQRGPEFPLIIGGGACAFNPEPLAEFFDALCLGDGEEAILEIVEAYQCWKNSGNDKADLYNKLSLINGIYVPSFSNQVTRRWIEDIDKADYPVKPVVPYMEVVHDRLTMEIARGCNRGCRYCQAGMTYRPARERSPENIACIAEKSLNYSGYDEISLASLSVGDYTRLEELQGRLNKFAERRISLSLPSLRPGTLRPELIDFIKQGRKTGFTIAPEAGTPRLRAVINKNISHQQILDTARLVFESGWETLKLYFMIGLPTEQPSDLEGIVELVNELKGLARGICRNYNLNITVTGFVPKAHTPFQWMPMDSLESLLQKQSFLQERLGSRRVQLKWQDPKVSFVEGLLARGDRRLSAVIHRAWELGAKFEGWSEYFRPERWHQALEDAGIDPAYYLTRPRPKEEVFPWEHLQTGVSREYLWREYERANQGIVTPDCRQAGCQNCGLNCKAVGCFGLSSSRNHEGQQLQDDTQHADVALEGFGLGTGRNIETTVPNVEGRYWLRVRFCKLGRLKFLSQLDMGRAFVRAMRRADVPVSYSEGFHPRPRISFGPGLPVGMESMAEYFDIELAAPLSPEEFTQRLNRCLPEGLKILAAMKLPESHSSISQQTHLYSYQVELPADSNLVYADCQARLGELLQRDSIPLSVTGKSGTKVKDIRPLIHSLKLAPQNGHLRLDLLLSPGVRPQEVVQQFYQLAPEKLDSLNIVRTEVYNQENLPILRSMNAEGIIS